MRPLTIEWVAPDCPPSTCFGPRLAQLTPDPGGFGFMPNGLAGPRIARSKVRFLAEARAIKPRGIFPSAPTRLLRNHSARPPGSSYSSTSSSLSRPAVVGGWINWSASRGFLGMVALFLSRYRTCMWPAGRQGRQLGSFSRLPAESTAHPASSGTIRFGQNGSSYRTSLALSQISRLGAVAGQVSGGRKPEVCCVYQITVSLSTEKVWKTPMFPVPAEGDPIQSQLLTKAFHPSRAPPQRVAANPPGWNEREPSGLRSPAVGGSSLYWKAILRFVEGEILGVFPPYVHNNYAIGNLSVAGCACHDQEFP